MYKMMKVFDCQDMPNDIQEIFFITEEVCNDVYIRVSLNNETYPVVTWLLENGASKEDEVVIVSHWW